MQFQVPQFIETEDKIIGPLTLKQFLYLALAGGACFGLYFILDTWLWLIVSIIVAVIAAALAFIKVNGRPLPIIAFAALQYYWKPRFYLWKHQIETSPQTHLPEIKRPILERLREQLLTSKAPIPKREKILKQPILDTVGKQSKERFEILRRITGEREVSRRVDYR